MKQTKLSEKLQQAWSDEVRTATIYRLLASRQRDKKAASIIRRMAEAEDSHRQSLEKRMSELGLSVASPDNFKLSWWQRLQISFAPLEKVIKAQEMAEESQSIGLYHHPTGDLPTDTLFSQLAHEEKDHAANWRELQAKPNSELESRVEAILSNETWHQSGLSWVSDAIYGANDGLAAVFGIVAGVSGATNSGSFVLTAGLAGALASALSMATGAFLAERSKHEVNLANLDRERQEINDHPEEEIEELSLYYQLKGVDQTVADQLARTLAVNPEAFLKVLAAEELNISGVDSHPGTAALAAGLSTGLGAMIPVLPFFWLHGLTGILVAAAVSLIAHFLVGAAKSLVTLRSWWKAGLEMTLAGIIVGSVTYLTGSIFHLGG